MTIQQLLAWLGGAGCVMAASWILEQINWYQTLSSNARKWVFFGVASALGLAAFAVGTYVPVEILDKIAPFFAIPAGVFGYVFLGDAFHKATK